MEHDNGLFIDSGDLFAFAIFAVVYMHVHMAKSDENVILLSVSELIYCVRESTVSHTKTEVGVTHKDRGWCHTRRQRLILI